MREKQKIGEIIFDKEEWEAVVIMNDDFEAIEDPLLKLDLMNDASYDVQCYQVNYYAEVRNLLTEFRRKSHAKKRISKND